MDLGERADRFRYLVRDRAGQFTRMFDAVFTGAGIEVLKIPSRCPRGQRLRRTVGEDATQRADRPDAYLRPTEPTTCPGRVPQALQREATTPGPEPVTATPTSPRHRPRRTAPDTPTTDPRRTDQRVRTSRIGRQETAGHRRYGEVLSPYRLRDPRTEHPPLPSGEAALDLRHRPPRGPLTAGEAHRRDPPMDHVRAQATTGTDHQLLDLHQEVIDRPGPVLPALRALPALPQLHIPGNRV